MKKTYKAGMLIGLVVLFIVCGYLFRLDRFGFTNIHWVDFIVYKNEVYTAAISTEGTRLTVDELNIGEKIGEVKYTLQGNVRSTFYNYRNFDASFLDKGTPIYQLKGNSNATLVVYLDDSYYLYQGESVAKNSK